jgi:hypothetical protein
MKYKNTFQIESNQNRFQYCHFILKYLQQEGIIASQVLQKELDFCTNKKICLQMPGLIQTIFVRLQFSHKQKHLKDFRSSIYLY